MMKVSDLEFLVPYTMKCRVYFNTDVDTEGCVAGKRLEYHSDKNIFDDHYRYGEGITFRELRGYKFVWNADIHFMEPCGNQMFIIIDKPD